MKMEYPHAPIADVLAAYYIICTLPCIYVRACYNVYALK